MTEFPAGFFDRADEADDAVFYGYDRLVTHIDAGAVAAVGDLYRELKLEGDVLDLCSSWISHFDPPPDRLVVMGMNANELAHNEAASESLVQDLNVDPALPFPGAAFDAVTCCVSIDYLTRPVEVFAEVARVLRPGGPFVLTFSNRCFPTKAIRAWLGATDDERCQIVESYFAAVDLFGPVTIQRRNTSGDPLFAVWATTPHRVEIRPATSSDQALISAMQYQAFFVPPGADALPRSILDQPDIRPYHDSFGTRLGDVGRIAVDSTGRAVGAAWVRQVTGYGFVDRDTPELGVAVMSEHRGHGVGRMLLESLFETVPRCSLSVDVRNPAKALYERLGFEVVRTDGEYTVIMLRDRRPA
ncbi:MAG: GNAT family N-acetyltransferase [Ilumatobacteraceae bacterium]